MPVKIPPMFKKNPELCDQSSERNHSEESEEAYDEHNFKTEFLENDEKYPLQKDLSKRRGKKRRRGDREQLLRDELKRSRRLLQRHRDLASVFLPVDNKDTSK